MPRTADVVAAGRRRLGGARRVGSGTGSRAVARPHAERSWSESELRSDALDVDLLGVRREGFEIIRVASEDGPAGLGEGNDKCIDCGTSAGSAAKLRSPPSQRFGDLVLEDAGLQEAVRVGITPRAAL